MNSIIRVPLNSSPEQFERLLALQSAFAGVCNALAPEVQKSKVWNRVTLHHLHYHALREQFPDLGSQMVCNAIHTVSKASKEIFQDPNSRWTAVAKSGQPLPILKFSDTTPVFFDKHTLTLKKNALSIFTLHGRMHIQINLSEAIETKLRTEKLKELSLLRQKNLFYLRFVFSEDAESSLPIKPSVKVIPDSYPEPLAA